MKKKLLFMIINMNIGGTEKALLNMLYEMNQDEYDVTLLMLEEYGGFLEEIPKWVKIKYLDEYCDIKALLNNPLHYSAFNYLKKGEVLKFGYFGFIYFITKITGNHIFLYKNLLKKKPIISDEYDVAIAYAGPMDFISYYVIKYIRASKKVQWIHFDVTKIGFNTKFANIIYPKFNHICVVSNEAKEKLLQLLPQLDNKVTVFRNIISKDLIIKKSEENKGFDDNYRGTRILTVGRLDFIKGQDLCIEAAKQLKDLGYDFRWYCVGEGSFRAELEKLIKAHKLENHFILLGSTKNPYPYMAKCDLYVQPSRHEGFCITLGEAKIFKKPLISTNFTGAREHIKDKETGLIVNCDVEELCCAVKKIIDNPMLSKKLQANLLLENI